MLFFFIKCVSAAVTLLIIQLTFQGSIVAEVAFQPEPANGTTRQRHLNPKPQQPKPGLQASLPPSNTQPQPSSSAQPGAPPLYHQAATNVSNTQLPPTSSAQRSVEPLRQQAATTVHAPAHSCAPVRQAGLACVGNNQAGALGLRSYASREPAMDRLLHEAVTAHAACGKALYGSPYLVTATSAGSAAIVAADEPRQPVNAASHPVHHADWPQVAAMAPTWPQATDYDPAEANAAHESEACPDAKQASAPDSAIAAVPASTLQPAAESETGQPAASMHASAVADACIGQHAPMDESDSAAEKAAAVSAAQPPYTASDRQFKAERLVSLGTSVELPATELQQQQSQWNQTGPAAVANLVDSSQSTLVPVQLGTKQSSHASLPGLHARGGHMAQPQPMCPAHDLLHTALSSSSRALASDPGLLPQLAPQFAPVASLSSNSRCHNPTAMPFATHRHVVTSGQAAALPVAEHQAAHVSQPSSAVSASPIHPVAQAKLLPSVLIQHSTAGCVLDTVRLQQLHSFDAAARAAGVSLSSEESDESDGSESSGSVFSGSEEGSDDASTGPSFQAAASADLDAGADGKISQSQVRHCCMSTRKSARETKLPKLPRVVSNPFLP